MAIVKQYHADTNTTYVYESESYWDSEKQQSRSRRRVIGKVDPVTGEVVPTGKRGRKKKEGQAPAAAAGPDPVQTAKTLDAKNKRIEELEEENRKLREALSRLEQLVSECGSVFAMLKN